MTSGFDVVIIGGGFAGVTLARRLERLLPANRTVALISAENSITFSPLLPEVVSAAIAPGHAIAPIRLLLKRTRFIMADVTGIDLEAKRIDYRSGGNIRSVACQHLVLACGTAANLAIIPGMAENAFPLKTVHDALAVRNRLLEILERADEETDAERQSWLGTVIVIGGGFTGIEVAGHVADFLRASTRYYPNLSREICRVIVVHNAPRILPEVSDRLSAFGLNRMRRRGITIHLDAAVSGVDGRGVALVSGDRIDGASIIGTIGTEPKPLIRDLPVGKQRGRIGTGSDFSVPDHAGLWALGDCAFIPNPETAEPAPPTAQAATQEAVWLAHNLARVMNGETARPFAYRSAGHVAAIGDQNAVAEIRGVRFGGFLAWVAWRGLFLIRFPTFSRKLRLAVEWIWSCLFPLDIAQLSGTASPTRQAPASARDPSDG